MNECELKTSQLQCPRYIIYHDEAVIAAAKSGNVSSELYHRLIRGTVHCMNSIACAPPFERYPSSAELEEMAKSIVMEYPCLMDPESKHVGIFSSFFFLMKINENSLLLCKL